MKLTLTSENTEPLNLQEDSCLYKPVKDVVEEHGYDGKVELSHIMKAIAISSLYVESDDDKKEHARVVDVLSKARDLDVFEVSENE